jgi:aspartate carbamoyltransferase catalytic subunit
MIHAKSQTFDPGDLEMFKDIITISDFSKKDILHILDRAENLKTQPRPDLLKGRILGSCFFEPSTRTRLSFETAMHRLGGSVVGFADAKCTSSTKGETLQDTMKMLENYVDVVVLRHPLEGAAQLAADTIEKPVINAGDGTNQHPTQTFLDLFTIRECQGKLEDLSIAMVGDLKQGRTVHSLAQALIPFRSRLYFVSPSSLEMPKAICDELREKGIKFSYHTSVEEIIGKLDILYVTRIQEERFPKGMEMNNPFVIKPEVLERAGKNLKVLHPLPRVNEIDRRVDSTPYAYYFQQAGNALYVRQALLDLVLN